MTDEPIQNTPASPGSAPGGEAAPTGLPPESRAARSLTDRSKTEEVPANEAHPLPEPEPEPIRGPRVWPRVVGVLILLVGAGGAWVWQNPGFVQTSLRSLFPGSTGRDAEAASIQALETRVARLEQRLTDRS